MRLRSLSESEIFAVVGSSRSLWKKKVLKELIDEFLKSGELAMEIVFEDADDGMFFHGGAYPFINNLIKELELTDLVRVSNKRSKIWLIRKDQYQSEKKEIGGAK